MLKISITGLFVFISPCLCTMQKSARVFSEVLTNTQVHRGQPQGCSELLLSRQNLKAGTQVKKKAEALKILGK